MLGGVSPSSMIYNMIEILPGEGEGCGVKILAVVKDFFGCGERITMGSELMVNVSLLVRDWLWRRFGRDSDFCGSSGGTSSGGVCGVRGDKTCGVVGCCLSVFRYSGVGSRVTGEFC